MSSEMHQPPRRDVPPSSPAPTVAAPRQRQEIASVPRRYGPGTLLVITAAYALLFAGFKAFGADQGWWIGTALFLTGIGLAQMIGGPKRARAASAVAGAVLLPLLIGGMVYVLYFAGDRPDPMRNNEVGDLVGLTCFAILGAPLGYLAGTLVAGIFLLMRYADTAIMSLKPRRVEEHPLEPEIVEKDDK